MKAVILAAGKGTRMLPLTKAIPKVLIKIKGKPFLWYVINNLKKAGFNDIGIVVGYRREKIKEFCRENKIKATLIRQFWPRGTGHAVKKAGKFVGSENFIVLGGDNLFSVADLQAVNKNDTFCYVVGKEEKENWQKYGVFVVEKSAGRNIEMCVEGDKLVKIVEKPKEFAGDLINIGLYKFPPEIWGALDKIGLSERGEYELTDAINLLAAEGKVKVLKLKDYWLDLGCKEDIRKIEEFLSRKL